jgi:hypothetical protein
VSWIDWLIAGYCSPKKCYLAINSAIFNVSEFIESHPGSPETLSENAGIDATEYFNEIGHSTNALSFMRQLCVFDAYYLYSERDDQMHHHREVKCRILNQHRNIPQPTILNEYMKHLQKKVANIPMVKQVIRIDEQTNINLCIGPTHKLVNSLSGYLECLNETHVGHPRAFFDPLSREWTIWWSCCGKGNILHDLPREILEDSVLRWLFEYS